MAPRATLKREGVGFSPRAHIPSALWRGRPHDNQWSGKRERASRCSGERVGGFTTERGRVGMCHS